MNKRLKVALLLALALISVFIITSCGEEPPFEEYDEDGYNVTVKYDANGGLLTDGVSVITDTYSVDSLPTKNGMKVAQLIDPENVAVRGDANKFVPTKNGYTCVGWYAVRTEVEDADGNKTYEYSKRWDFKNDRLEIDPKEDYSSSEPVLTLYAAWVPDVSVEFYSLSNPDTLIGKLDNVKAGGEINVPSWNAGLGAMYMGSFPTIEGKTYIAAYLDAEGNNRITGTTVAHTGVINYETAVVENPVMKIYIDAWDGVWKYVYSAEDLITYKDATGLVKSGLDLEGNFAIMDDIDFLKASDPAQGIYLYHSWLSSVVTGDFNGKIVGVTKENGENVKIKNIQFTQASTSSPNYNGLFGKLGENAVIKNVGFENIVMTIDSGAPMATTMYYGLLAGRIDDNATLENVTLSGTIKISSECQFKANARVSIGLVCGGGDNRGIDYSSVTCEKLNDKPGFEIELFGDSVEITLPRF